MVKTAPPPSELPVYDLAEADLEAPERVEVAVADILAPLSAALQQTALDLANARAELRSWKAHAGLLAEQVRALREQLRGSP